ncbi:MAG TPA: polymer-forming cytoskeletal protein, partial [Polyangiaceae bacterium]|nr:polymer-forming cytoskeletal protein [Polyangiaceae bacterium]
GCLYFAAKATTIGRVDSTATEITALLGRGTQFEGKLYFEGQVRIDGGFRGEIRSPGTLIVGDGAAIEGEIEAATVIVKGGRLSANVRATTSIELYVPAQVTGNLHAPQIFMDKGVQFSGNLTMSDPHSVTPQPQP